jgi:hypothetical protein
MLSTYSLAGSFRVAPDEALTNPYSVHFPFMVSNRLVSSNPRRLKAEKGKDCVITSIISMASRDEVDVLSQFFFVISEGVLLSQIGVSVFLPLWTSFRF